MKTLKAQSNLDVDNIKILSWQTKQQRKCCFIVGGQDKIFWNAHQIAGHYTVIDVPSRVLCLLPSVISNDLNNAI